jgi:hypothetical protein
MKTILKYCLLLSFVLYGTLVWAGGVPGKIVFSNVAFGATDAGAKTSFSSSDYIYGRLELDGMTIRDAFKIKSTGDKPYLQCNVKVLKNGEETGQELGSTNFILLKAEDLGKSWFNFDILPDPAKTTSVYSMLDDFSAGLGFTPLYNLVNETTFPDEGKYEVVVELYSVAKDSWGNDQESDKWPLAKGSFDFGFREADIETLQNNKKKVTEMTRENAFRYESLPPVFSSPGPLNDPNATAAKISAILKRDLPERTILKFAAEKVSGTQWNIAKDDYGLPKYRYFTPDIWVAYKLDGRCYVGTVTLREVYQGGGTFGPLQVAFTSASEQQDRGIDCTKVK